MESFVEAINYGLTWLSTGIYDFADEFLKQATAYYVIAVIKAKIAALGFAWDVAKIVLQNIGLSQYISNAWTSFSPQMLGYLSFFKVPEALNIVVQAYVTRIVLSITGL